MKTVVQFGAGNIGRGFLGQLYSQSGWRTVYIDVNPEMIRLLNERKGFTIRIVGDNACDIGVKNVCAVDGKNLDAVAEAIDQADLLGTSVGVNALKFIIPALTRGLARRAARGAGVDIIICENLLDSAKHLRGLIDAAAPELSAFMDSKVGLVETVVSRMIPPLSPEERGADPLAIAVEAYSILPVARRLFKNGVPDIVGFDPTDDIHAYEERKLFCHNCMHAMASYFGYAKGHAYVWEAIADADIRARVAAGGWESAQALMRRHAFSDADIRAHMNDLLKRFTNRALGDTVARCGGDPIRKLGPRDRLVGAALLTLEQGIEPTVLVEAIVAALRFNPAGDVSAPKLQEMLRSGGLPAVLKDVCGLEAGHPLAQRITAAYARTVR